MLHCSVNSAGEDGFKIRCRDVVWKGDVAGAHFFWSPLILSSKNWAGWARLRECIERIVSSVARADFSAQSR